MSTRSDFLSAVDAYLAATGMAAWAIGHAACGNAKAVSRIRGGLDVRLSTLESLEAFMRANPTGVRVPRPWTRRVAETKV